MVVGKIAGIGPNEVSATVHQDQFEQVSTAPTDQIVSAQINFVELCVDKRGVYISNKV